MLTIKNIWFDYKNIKNKNKVTFYLNRFCLVTKV